ncbi:hypothetical protein ACHAWF_018657 [Thalassiosira exigua]
MFGKTLGADGLMILTDVPGVALNFGKPNQKFIRSASPERLLEFASDGVDGSANFPDGSMGPKAGSAIEFVQRDGSDDNTERWSMIGSLKDASGMLLGEAGTRVTNKHGADHLGFY